MKKLLVIIIALSILCGAGLVATVSNYDVKVNGQPLSATVLNQNGKTYLPARQLAESLGADVSFSGSTVNINTVDVEELKKACVTIYASNGETYDQGSGVYVDYDQVLTAYHVVDEGRTQVRTTADKNDLNKMAVVSSAPAIDVALLSPTIQQKPVKIGDSDDVKVGDKVIVISAPGGKNDTVTYATVLEPDSQGIVIECTLEGGSSGGGVFNLNGEIIGILKAGDASKGACLVKPINDIRKAL